MLLSLLQSTEQTKMPEDRLRLSASLKEGEMKLLRLFLGENRIFKIVPLKFYTFLKAT